MKFRFSVVMAVFNRAKYLHQAIDSVLAQTFTDFELIAVDDGSTDESLEILESYGSRIRVVRQPNQGPEVARNTGAALAQGEYLMMVDSDDLLLPNAMATYDRVIRTFDSPPLVLGSQIYFRDDEVVPAKALAPHPVEVLKYHDYFSKDTIKSRSTFGVSNGNLVIRKSVFDEVGGFRNSTPQTFHAEDQNLILKLGTYGPFIVLLKPYTCAFRRHQENSLKNVNAITDGVLRLQNSERHGEYPGGSERRWDRYAAVGGMALFWAYKGCWRAGHRKLACRVVLKSAPMVFAALWKKSFRYFRKPVQPIVLQEL